MSEVQLSEIDKSYGKRPVLDHLELTAAAGEYLVILGPSGCGKTTILRLIAGLEPPDSGGVLIGEKNMSGVPPRRRDVSMVFQGDALYPHLTVRQSLRLGLRRSCSAAQATQRIESATRLAGAGAILDRKPDRLSGGERRRAALAKAIVRHCSVRLLDEPLSALDSHVRHGIQQAILDWHATTPGTTIHVTHDGQEAMRMADRIAVIDAGRVVQCDTPDEIYAAPGNQMVALALGWPPISFLPASVTGGQLESPMSAVSTPRDMVMAGDDGEVEIGIRAESCQIVGPAARHDSGLTLRGKLLRIEPTEGRKLAAIRVGAITVMAEVDPAATAVGADVQIFVPATKLHVFEQATGRRRNVGTIP